MSHKVNRSAVAFRCVYKVAKKYRNGIHHELGKVGKVYVFRVVDKRMKPNLRLGFTSKNIPDFMLIGDDLSCKKRIKPKLGPRRRFITQDLYGKLDLSHIHVLSDGLLLKTYKNPAYADVIIDPKQIVAYYEVLQICRDC
jgi:hypothetical protein